MKRWAKFPLAAIAAALLQTVFRFLSSGVTASIGSERLTFEHIFSLLFSFSFGTGVDAMPIVVVGMIFFFVFCILSCDMLSEDFCLTGVYLFTRLRKKSRWYIARIAQLFGSALAFCAVYVAVSVTVAMLLTGVGLPDMGLFLYLVLQRIVSFTLLCFLGGLAINLISISGGTVRGTLVVWIVIALLVLILNQLYATFWELTGRANPEVRMGAYIQIELPLWLLICTVLNPISAIQIQFHQAPQQFYEFVQEYKQTIGNGFDYVNLPQWWEPLLALLGICVLLTAAGWFYLRRKDISLANQEQL